MITKQKIKEFLRYLIYIKIFGGIFHMNEYRIKEVSLDDLKDCAKVIRTGFGTVAKEFGLTIFNCASNEAFINDKKLISDFNKGDLMYALYEDSIIVGFIQLEKKSNVQFELVKITVLPEYRHCGYGKILLDFAKNKVLEQQGKKMTIGIIEENTILKNWYTRNGFIHTGTYKFHLLPFTVGFMEVNIKR